ncbi:hypothetical protein LEP1GSC133_3785 [Leptospira borgpetersenii serovar Pomona str. 200901868]|uniref:Uncharacterized protein n=1 Tax=Leptospira borgpetersenii serovar Pomona str. 200901868 TaxID=1192866 RepID=M6WKH0_LEPBO|nr:hypothetical protein LEP1GSC133_3785 [Leptospira borgpetersenii serovar Pomona str. 200901868]
MNRFRFSFDSLVWKNLRRGIQQTTPSPFQMNENGSGGLSNSLWYRILFAFLIVMNERLDRINWLYKQIWLYTADGKGLDWWGARYGLPRNPSESDAAYLLRIIFLLEYRRLPATIATKRSLASRITGHPIDKINVEEVFDHKYKIGDPIGSVIGSRNYCFFAFRIYIPKIDNLKRQNLIRILDTINIGGNVWEVWEELDTNEAPPIFEGSQIFKGTRLSEGPLGFERYWLVY